MKTAIIDADSLAFQSSRDTLEESIQVLDDRIFNILDKTECTDYISFVSIPPYFRHKVSNEYKSNRKTKSPLKWLKTLKWYMVEKHNAISIKGIEADDSCSIIMNNLEAFGLTKDTAVLAAIDKDVLKTIPGRHFNYRYSTDKLGIVSFGKFVETSEHDAARFIWYQLLIGDSVDGIVGVKGIGEKGAAKLLDHISTNDLPSTILNVYIEHYGNRNGINNFHTNYNLVYMLKTFDEFSDITDKDFITELKQ